MDRPMEGRPPSCSKRARCPLRSYALATAVGHLSIRRKLSQARYLRSPLTQGNATIRHVIPT